jgi:hypothetical protein
MVIRKVGHASYSKCPIVRSATDAQNGSGFDITMSHLTIVAEDSPLQYKSRRPRLSEDGWEICAEPPEGEIVPEQRREGAIVNFPAPDDQTKTRTYRSQSQNPAWLVITVHKDSSLLQYESHYRPAAMRQAELAPVLETAIHQIEPFQIQEKAEPLVLQLSPIENQSREFHEVDLPDAIAIAVHNYRERLRQDILDELDQLKDSVPTQ